MDGWKRRYLWHHAFISELLDSSLITKGQRQCSQFPEAHTFSYSKVVIQFYFEPWGKWGELFSSGPLRALGQRQLSAQQGFSMPFNEVD